MNDPTSDQPHPSGVLMYVVVTLLAPMFIGVTGGDIGMARMAAVETINGYRAGSHSDLIAVAQIIGFGLAALGSLSLSMADDITLQMTLRLRGNANALNRSAEQNRRVVRDNRAETQASLTQPQTTAWPADEDDWPQRASCEPFLSPAAEQELAAESEARLCDPQQTFRQPPAPTSAQIPEPAGLDTDQRRKAIWADAMTKEAAEIRASIPKLPLTERGAAEIRVGALGDAANQLLSETKTSSSFRDHFKLPYPEGN